MSYRMVVFDFDGTLVDSSAATGEAFAQLARGFGVHDLSFSDVRNRHSLPPARRLKLLTVAAGVYLQFRKLYGQLLDRIDPIPAMLSLMDALLTQGQQVAVVTSNTADNISRFLSLQDFAHDIPVLSGGLFGKHRSLRTLARATGLSTGQMLYVGDELRDIRACRRCGVHMAFVRWGFDRDADLSALPVQYDVDSPEQLRGLLLPR